MIRNAPASAASVQVPVQNFDPTGLPLAHLVALRSKLNQIIESLFTLIRTIDGDGLPGMAAWPDILSKYNNLLIQSHTLITSLSGVDIPQPARRPGEARRERINPFETIALHPLTVNGPSGPGSGGLEEPPHHGMLENLLRTDPHPEVIKRWDETVRRFVERRKGGIQVEPQDVMKEMIAMREGHDARIDRALKVVEELRDRWDWKARVALDEMDEAEEGRNDGSSEGPIVIDDDDDDEEEEEEDTTMKTQEGTQTQTPAPTASGQPMQEDTQDSMQPPPTTQNTIDERDNMFSDDSSDDEDDDDEFEDVMQD